MGKNAHIRVPIYQQQQALRVAAKQFVNHVSSLPDEGAASSSPSTCAGFPATSPKTPRATSPATPTGTATFAISDPTWTWRPSSSHLQPTWAPQPESKCGAGLQRAFMEDPGPASLEAPPIATRHNAASITRRPSSPHAQPTWAPQPERKCGGHGGGDHACALAVDVAALLQLTAWVEKLDAINHMNSGEDQVIINIRSQAVGVLDVWTKRWYVKHAMSDDAQR